jgi:hypothetical protein
MSKVRVVGNSFACLCLFASAASAATIWNVTLSGDQEVPPVVTSRTGTATVELNDDQSLLTYTIDTFGFDIGGIKTPRRDGRHHGCPYPCRPGGREWVGCLWHLLAAAGQNNRFITINGDTGLIQFRGVWDAADVLNGAQPLADQLLRRSAACISTCTPRLTRAARFGGRLYLSVGRGAGGSCAVGLMAARRRDRCRGKAV